MSEPIDIEAIRKIEADRLMQLYQMCQKRARSDPDEKSRAHARRLLPRIAAQYRLWAGRPIDEKRTDE